MTDQTNRRDLFKGAAVAGVAGVDVLGGAPREFVVEVDPARAQALGLSLADVATALGKGNDVQGIGRIRSVEPRGGDVVRQPLLEPGVVVAGAPRRRHRAGAEGQRAEDRCVARHVEAAHEPADGAEEVLEVREVLHEQDEGREERVEGDDGD